MDSVVENLDQKPFVMMMMVMDRLQQAVLATSSQTQVALVESLTKRQGNSLFVVSRLNDAKPEGVALKELADHLNMTVPATSVLVEGMVQKGLLSRIPSVTDRRAVCIKLSPLGQEIYANCCGQIKQLTEDLVAGIADEDMQTFKRVIRHIYEQVFQKTVESSD